MAIIKDKSLSGSGRDKINWVKSYMPALNLIGDEFEKSKPFNGVKITTSVHLEAKTAFLVMTLIRGGAEVRATGCNPLSTQDDVAAALYEAGADVYAVHGVSDSEYFDHLKKALEWKPDLIIDDGGDLVNILHEENPEYATNLIGGCEETTTGIHRLISRQKSGSLNFPMVDVNDADCKHLFDNRYGTGQSTLTAMLQTTNLTIAGRTAVIAGYGWCGRGVADKARGLGANVIITEVDPIKALEARMEGYTVMTMDEAAPLGDFFITLTGCKDVIVKRHFDKMKDGAVLANSGHFDVEINKTDLAYGAEIINRKPNITGYKQKDGRMLNLLAEGRLVNLAAGNGHPAEIMDMSFAIQSKSLLWLLNNKDNLENRVYPVPKETDIEVAKIKLKASGITHDELTEEQEKYLNSYS